jgi:hypothetical protein
MSRVFFGFPEFPGVSGVFRSFPGFSEFSELLRSHSRLVKRFRNGTKIIEERNNTISNNGKQSPQA